MERSINMILSQLNKETQSDKGTHHSYIDMYYESTFLPLKEKTNVVVEIGVCYGNSMRLWHDYFLNATIYGIDKDPRSHSSRWQLNQNNNRCKIIKGSSNDISTYKEIPNDIDIVIDDGSHRIQDQLNSFNILYPKLKDSGVYVIEDIRNIDSTIKQFKDLENSHKVTVKIFDFRNLKNIKDDVIVEIRK
jgi:hypothetical protein